MRPLIITMGILSFFSSSKGQQKPHEGQAPAAIAVDLKKFKIGASLLGAPIAPEDPFHAALLKQDVYKLDAQGSELGTKDGLLDYGYFNINSFKGTFSRSGDLIKVGAGTTEKDILKIFGEPYWTDRSDGEVIMFYEYQAGTIELQFEFSDGKSLSVITLARNGVLSEADQRKAYGVTKPWPPK
jgi:hypothetical protein